MTEPDPPELPFGMSERTLLRLSWWLAAFFFGMAILGVVGEVLGWWNDIGELLVTVGTLAGLAVAIGGTYYTAGRSQTAAVHATVEDNNELLQDNNEILQESNEKLDQLEQLEQLEKIDRQIELLQGIHDRL